METKYYLAKGVNKVGPLSLDELKQKSIKETDLIWHEGLTGWKTAKEFTELKSIVIAVPPPTPMEMESKIKARSLSLAFKQTIGWFFLIGISLFFAGGGFVTDSALEKLYPSYGDHPIYATADELRYELLPIIAFLIIALPVSIIIMIIKYNKFLKRK